MMKSVEASATAELMSDSSSCVTGSGWLRATMCEAGEACCLSVFDQRFKPVGTAWRLLELYLHHAHAQTVIRIREREYLGWDLRIHCKHTRRASRSTGAQSDLRM